VPHAAFRGDAQAQVGETERLGRDLVGHREVAAGALDDDIDADAGSALHLQARADAKVAAPSEPRLQGLQDRRDGDRIDGRLRIEPRRRRAIALLPGDPAPAQRSAEHVGHSGVDADAKRCAGPENAAANVARAEPDARRGRGRASDELAKAAAPAAGTVSVDVDEPAFGDDRDDAARSRRRAGRRRGLRARCGRRRFLPRDDGVARRACREGVGPFRRQQRGRDTQFGAMGARRSRHLRIDAAERKPVDVDVVEGERGGDGGVGAAAQAPAAARLTDTEGMHRQRRGLQLAIAGDARPAPGEMRAQREASGERRRSALDRTCARRGRDQRRQRIEARRVDDDAPVVVARAARRDRSFELDAVAAGDEVERGSRPAVDVGEPPAALHRNAGNDAVDDGEAGATRRRCQRGVRALGDPFGRDEEIELDSCVDRVRAARQQRFGAAGPPRRGVEAGELGAAGGTPGFARRSASEPAGERRAGVAERRLEAAQLDIVRAGTRVQPNSRRLRRRPRQSCVGERAGEIGAELDSRQGGGRGRDRRRAREAGADKRDLAADDGVRCARIERGRPDRAQLGVDAPRRRRPAAAADDAAGSTALRAELGRELADVDHVGLLRASAQLGTKSSHRQESLVPAPGARVGEIDRHQRRRVQPGRRHRGLAAQGRRRQAGRECGQIEAARGGVQRAERPGRERADHRARVERLRRMRGAGRDARGRARVERGERADGSNGRAPPHRRCVAGVGRGAGAGHGVDRGVDGKRRIRGDRQRAARAAAIDRAGERVDAVAGAAIGTEMDVRANAADRHRLDAADPQLVDGRLAHVDLERQAQAVGDRRGLRRSRRGLATQTARSACKVSIARCSHRPRSPPVAASARQRGASRRSSPASPTT
jgi:hypothetical protein